MANVQKEIWLRDLVGNFFPDNSFASKSVSDDAFVESGKKVHVTNDDDKSEVKKNSEHIQGKVEKRADSDVEYPLNEFTTNPILIPDAETVELSYDKRMSVIAEDKAELQRVASEDLLTTWAPDKSGCVYTTGEAKPAHQAAATGNRKAITADDVLNLQTKFDQENISPEGRYLLLDAVMYAELLRSLTNTDKLGFFQAADVKKGIVGQLYGFNVMKRSSVLRYAVTSGAATGLATENAATDCAAGLAWQERCVRRALGEVKMFDESGSPTYYGDIYSFLVRCGGAKSRTDKKGVYAIVGITA